MFPNEISIDGPFYQGLKAAFSDAGAQTPEAFRCNFALDAGFFARRNIEAVMLGPGEIDQFHSDEEHVLVADLVEMSRVYRALIDGTKASSRERCNSKTVAIVYAGGTIGMEPGRTGFAPNPGFAAWVDDWLGRQPIFSDLHSRVLTADPILEPIS